MGSIPARFPARWNKFSARRAMTFPPLPDPRDWAERKLEVHHLAGSHRLLDPAARRAARVSRNPPLPGADRDGPSRLPARSIRRSRLVGIHSRRKWLERCARFYSRPRRPSLKSEMIESPRNNAKSVWEMLAADPARLVNPSTPAISARTAKVNVQLCMIDLDLFILVLCRKSANFGFVS